VVTYLCDCRYSGEFSVSSSASSKRVQPRYLDISKYKGEAAAAKQPLRKDARAPRTDARIVSRGSAQHLEMGRYPSSPILFVRA
jgi:hypothetical protein